MRQITFRSLAGLLAVGFVWVAEKGQAPIHISVEMLVLAIVFAIYALWGQRAADRVLNMIHGKSASRRTHEDRSDGE
jgi:hypothetical protein